MFERVFKKSVGGAMLAALTITMSAEQVQADIGKAAVGVIIGCATGVLNCRKKSSRVKRSGGTRKKRSGMSAAQRQQNKNVQSALNTFGFPVGGVDGSLGPKSRAAIRDYQGYMGYPQTGQLTDYERETLVNGWQKFQAGAGSAYPRTMAAVGPRGMLNTERDPNYPAQYGDPVNPNYAYNGNNGGYNANGGYVPPNNNGWDQTGNVPQPVPQIQQKAINPVPAPLPNTGGEVIGEDTAALPMLKPLKPVGKVTESAAARCELVDQTTRIQGGVIQANNMTDSNQALSEKFCEARGFAITQGQAVATQYAVSDNEMNDLCKQIETGFNGMMAGLPTMAAADAANTAKNTAAGLGLTDPSTAATYGQICMGIGYRLDNSEMALAGAMAMLAAGQAPYGEIVGHHLREGFGVTKTPNAAVSWYTNAIDALEQGATPVILPSTTPERIKVIRAALKLESQQAGNTGALPKLVPAASKLPLLQPVKQ